MLQMEVRKKLDVLVSLRKGKVGPVQRLAILSDSAPDKLWLTKYSESGNNISIAGVAFNEELIAEYMRNLENSTGFEAVELIVSEQSELAGIKLKKFELKLQLEGTKASEPAISSAQGTKAPVPATTVKK
jgi:type IV pilus assembly protein PilN